MNQMKLGWTAWSMALLFSAGAFGTEAGTDLDLARHLNQAFIDVAEKVSATVVVVNTVERLSAAPTTPEDGGSFDELPPGFWREFHERFRGQQPERTLGQGSGVLIRRDGYILTNRHVVEDADTIDVRLQDGRTFKATVRGVDVQSDLAVIKIDATNLPAARFADSSHTRVGEFAIAIGAPFSLDYSFTFGHVSAKGRSNVVLGPDGAAMDQDFVQTDALINPGNSGGPLVNIEGEVIGINTLIHGLRTGIGFAIPSNLAKEISDHLVADGKFVRPWLGISIQALRDVPELRQVLNGVQTGVVVSGIAPNGPAAKSELRPSDVITAVAGHPVATSQELRTEIRRSKIGEPVTLDVVRRGQPLQVKVKPAEWTEPAGPVVAAKSSATQQNAQPAAVGVTVQPTTADLASRFGNDALEGVTVATVEKDSLAAKQGIKPGDIITAIDQQPVTNPEQFRDALKKADLTKGILMNLVSGNTARFELLKSAGR